MGRKTIAVSEEAYEMIDELLKTRPKDNISGLTSELLVLTVKKEKWLKKAHPNITFVEIIDNNIVLRDKNLKNPYVEIKYGDKCHLWCSYCHENHCGHVYYCVGLPQVALLVDCKEKKK